MNGGLVTVVAAGLLAACVILAILVIYLLLRPKPRSRVSVYSSIQQMRSIGHLSVFKVFTKEIVTKAGHTWGEVGRKYLSWVMSEKKMAMIFEFDIDFRYDLRRSEFDIVPAADGLFLIKMPPCFHEAHIRDIHFYDEQGSRFLPWLLPGLLGEFLASGFSVEDKNKLVDEAKEYALRQALELITKLQSEVQNSAKATLLSISRAFGARDVAFEFAPQGDITLDVSMPKKLAA